MKAPDLHWYTKMNKVDFPISGAWLGKQTYTHSIAACGTSHGPGSALSWPMSIPVSERQDGECSVDQSWLCRAGVEMLALALYRDCLASR